MVINNIDQKALILKNTILENTDNNYLKVKLKNNNPANKLTSKVYIYYGDQLQMQEYSFVRGYESTMQECLFFGLSDYKMVDKIKIIWPDNNIQILESISTNQTLEIEYQKTNLSEEQSVASSPIMNKINPSDIGIDFVHTENEFDDFQKEILLPQKQTAFGPALAKGDINNDGLEDFYIGGAKGQKAVLYIQRADGTFEKNKSQPWESEFYSEDVDACFVDVNNDGYQDLFVLSGGSGDFVGQEPLLLDRFYANNGKGEFFRIANVLPEKNEASYSIVTANIDDDEYMELLIIGAAKPGLYPQKENCYLLDNTNNTYTDVTDQLIPELNDADGLIRDAEFVDLNGDGKLDLITVGEWQTIEVYIFENNQFVKRTSDWNNTGKYGWWRSITQADLDNDGDLDFIVGNVGKNFKQKASKEYPLYLYSNDFDGNGTLDCVLAKPYKDKVVPARGKECSTEQMPFISEKYKTYKDFASASVVDIYGKEKLESGISLQANDFYSYIIWNEGTHFNFEKLPVLAQVSPINASEVFDFNNDGLQDIIIAGNDYNTEYETPRLDAGHGLVLINMGDRKFKPLSIAESGVYCPNDAKKIIKINIGNTPSFIVGNNNNKPEILKLHRTES